jgi:hypothetical protein
VGPSTLSSHRAERMTLLAIALQEKNKTWC